MMCGFKFSKLPSSDAFFIKDPMQRFHNLPKQHHQMGTKNSDIRAYGDIAHSEHHSGSHLINVMMAFWGHSLSISNVFVSGKHLWIDSLYILFCFSGILNELCCVYIETFLLFSVITTFSYVSSSLLFASDFVSFYSFEFYHLIS